MLPEDVSVSWTKEARKEASEAFNSPNDAPVIYKRGNEGARCTISLRIPGASQATVVSNARSCEFYELDALGRKYYQGYCQGVSRGPGRWELTVAGKVSIAHYVSCTNHIAAGTYELYFTAHSCIQLLKKGRKAVAWKTMLSTGRQPLVQAGALWPLPSRPAQTLGHQHRASHGTSPSPHCRCNSSDVWRL